MSCGVPMIPFPDVEDIVLFTPSVNSPTNSGLSSCWGIRCGVLLARWPALLREVPVSPAGVIQPQESACILATQMAGVWAAYRATQKLSDPFCCTYRRAQRANS